MQIFEVSTAPELVIYARVLASPSIPWIAGKSIINGNDEVPVDIDGYKDPFPSTKPFRAVTGNISSPSMPFSACQTVDGMMIK